MISDENQLRAAYTMADAAEKMRLAADQFDQASQRLERLFGIGYGSNIDRLIDALEKPSIISETAEQFFARTAKPPLKPL